MELKKALVTFINEFKEKVVVDLMYTKEEDIKDFQSIARLIERTHGSCLNGRAVLTYDRWSTIRNIHYRYGSSGDDTEFQAIGFDYYDLTWNSVSIKTATIRVDNEMRVEKVEL